MKSRATNGSLPLRINQRQQLAGGRRGTRLLVREHALAIDQDFELSHGMTHTGLNPVFGSQFALKAHGRAS